ncbi:MAG: ABC transporter ATP-binding protein [Pleurocapsa sp. MO_226.B13]|nr:ABC transporter ATP-binding protein [Pleurocapsa sp. MO_226.B13]
MTNVSANNSVKEATVPGRNRAQQSSQALWRLISYMSSGKNRGPFIVATLVRIASVVAMVTTPYFIGQAVNVLSAPNSPADQLRQWVGLSLVAIVIYLVLSSVAERSFARLATNALCDLQSDLFNNLQRLSLTFFDRQPIGELMSRVTNDTETVSLFYEDAVSQIIRALFTILAVVILMFVFNWQLTLVTLLFVPVMLVSTAVTERISSPAFERLQEELSNLSGFQEETISSHKVIISSRRHEWATAHSEELADGVFDVGSKAYFASLVQFPIMQMLTMMQLAIVFLVGSLLVLDGKLQLGTVIAFTNYAVLLSAPLSEIANMMSTMLRGLAGGRRIFSIIDEQPSVVDPPNAAAFAFKTGHVVFENVDFSYVPGRKILRHNTFEAKPGETIGICGPTGAGKSTIINILTRYYNIDSGTIWIDGQNIATLTQESLRKQIGAVLQEAFLFSDTVMNNLKYAREGATEEECIAAAKQANAHEFIINLPQGYDTMMTERGANLSQGQRQMITIGRAMVADPKILILDEATSNVDTRTEKLIQEGLQRLMANKTSFVIAHRLSTIRNSAKIMVLNAGEIVEMDSHDNLMAQRGFYYALYMSQFKGKGPAAG